MARLAVVAAVVLGLVPLAAVPAAAQTTFLCSDFVTEGRPGYVYYQRIEGDLVADIPWCYLVFTTVVGDVEVLEGATFDTHSSTLLGDVRAAGDTALEETTVLGSVVLTAPGTNVDLKSSHVADDVLGDGASVSLRWSTVAGRYETTATARIVSSMVSGAFSARGGRVVVHWSEFGDQVLLAGTWEVILCGASIAGDLTVTEQRNYARLGVLDQIACRTYVAGSALLLSNPHSLDLGDLDIRGDLVCEGNTGPRGITGLDRVSVAGTRSGQCAAAS
ncbi:hypothetical protein [Cellulomonas cellasea]|uniref:Auto-transporter adhesin head GIN domain-containing protein n=1 Tax=Cellulomonas cellasea DSM 20118 TaxID=1408250 RepID=A0A0A0B9Z5_9CELL|nr:hypothetical protein [Cellulomonas cellasea]KGM03710.1 hypothetical protein Q760_14770 [Cellulomonas cellasea DSM 20118]